MQHAIVIGGCVVAGVIGEAVVIGSCDKRVCVCIAIVKYLEVVGGGGRRLSDLVGYSL